MAESGGFTKWPAPQPLFGAAARDGPSDSLYTNAYTRYPGADLHLMFPAVFRQVATTPTSSSPSAATGALGRAHRANRSSRAARAGAKRGAAGTWIPRSSCCLTAASPSRTRVHGAGITPPRELLRAGVAGGARPAGHVARAPARRLAGRQPPGVHPREPVDRRGQLTLNYRTDRGGWIRTALRENIPHPPQPVDPLPGYSFNQCESLAGRPVPRAPPWNGRADLSSLPGRKINVRFELNRATIFAFELGAATDERHSI